MDQYKSKVEQACRIADDFTKLYYSTLDKQRHLLSRLYLNTAVLSWNGNGVKGNMQIEKFLIDLPPTDHALTTIDAQPVLDSAVNGQLTFIVQVSGTVKYQKKPSRTFQQNFMVTVQGDKWKVVSDCFRLQEPLPL